MVMVNSLALSRFVMNIVVSLERIVVQSQAKFVFPFDECCRNEVSTLVNSPENDLPACIQPVSRRQPSKSQLPLL
jgi:hypothetical protein